MLSVMETSSLVDHFAPSWWSTPIAGSLHVGSGAGSDKPSWSSAGILVDLAEHHHEHIVAVGCGTAQHPM